MIVDERSHEFWVARDRHNALFVCGDVLNVGRSHGETPRSALERHLATIRARMRSLEAILASDDAERAERELAADRAVRASEITLRPKSLDENFHAIVRRLDVPG